MSATVAIAALLSGWLAPDASTPEPPAGFDMTWSAPAGCPTRADVLARVEDLVGAPIERLNAPTLHAHAEVVTMGANWQLRLHLESPSGATNKRIDAPRCDTLANVVAVELAFALDVVVATQRTEALVHQDAAPEPADVTVATATRSPPDGARSVPRAAENARPRAALAIAAGPTLGHGPAIAGAIVAIVAVSWQRVRLELGGRTTTPTRARLSGDDAGAVVLSGTVSVSGCALPRLGPLELPVCAGLEAGTLRGRGFGLAKARTTHEPWLAALLGVGVAWAPRRRFALWMRVQASAFVLRPGLRVRDVGPLWRAPVLSGTGLLGVELRLP